MCAGTSQVTFADRQYVPLSSSREREEVRGKGFLELHRSRQEGLSGLHVCFGMESAVSGSCTALGCERPWGNTAFKNQKSKDKGAMKQFYTHVGQEGTHKLGIFLNRLHVAHSHL